MPTAMTQILLFPDPKPLVERLGRDFFRQLPERPGVYLMRGPGGALLYVGKAKNLRRRLGSYRVANPDRMPRRHLRLLRAVQRIEIEECADELAALAREAYLLRTLRPKYNRAGTWPAPPKFLAWKLTPAGLQLLVTTMPGADFHIHGPCGAGAKYLQVSLTRLLWRVLHPDRGISRMPAGWFRGRFGDTVAFDFSGRDPELTREAAAQLELLFSGHPDGFNQWVLSRLPPNLPPFEKNLLEEDLEFLANSL